MGKGREWGAKKGGGFTTLPSSFVKSWLVLRRRRRERDLAFLLLTLAVPRPSLPAISISHKLPYIRSDTGYAPRSPVTCATLRSVL